MEVEAVEVGMEWGNRVVKGRMMEGKDDRIVDMSRSGWGGGMDVGKEVVDGLKDGSVE